MLVSNVSTFRFRLPLRHAVVLRQGLSITERTGVVLRVETDEGKVGWGEASPLPGFSRETVLEVGIAAGDLVRGAESALSVGLTLNELSALVDEANRFPSLGFAIGTAARMIGVNAGVSAGDKARSARSGSVVHVARLLQGGPGEIIASAETAVRDGYSCLKLKVGRASMREEIETVKAVRRVATGEIGLRLDANRAWSLPEAVQFCQALSGVQIEFIEEPLADPSGIPMLIRDTMTPVALDESVITHAHLIESGLVAAAVVKPTVVGMRMAEQIRKWCAAQEVLFVPSASYESCIGTSMVALLSVSGQEEPPVAVGIGTHAYLKEDLSKDHPNFAGPTLRIDEVLAQVGNIDMSRLMPIT